MSKHTPGPWSVYDDSNDGKTNRIEIVAIGKTVARIYNSVPAQDLPNARLIAAAPDMYEALREAREYVAGAAPAWHRRTQETLAVIDAALAKADGK